MIQWTTVTLVQMIGQSLTVIPHAWNVECGNAGVTEWRMASYAAARSSRAAASEIVDRARASAARASAGHRAVDA